MGDRVPGSNPGQDIMTFLPPSSFSHSFFPSFSQKNTVMAESQDCKNLLESIQLIRKRPTYRFEDTIVGRVWYFWRSEIHIDYRLIQCIRGFCSSPLPIFKLSLKVPWIDLSNFYKNMEHHRKYQSYNLNKFEFRAWTWLYNNWNLLKFNSIMHGQWPILQSDFGIFPW